MDQSETFLLHVCPHCSGHIEFPSRASGEEFNCPHCSQKTILRENQRSERKLLPAIKQKRSALVIAITVGIAAILIFVAGVVFSSKKEKQRALEDIKAELVTLKIGVRDGLSLSDVRSHRKNLNVKFEINKKHLPSNFSLSSLNVYLESSAYFWERRTDSDGFSYTINQIDAVRMETILSREEELDKLYAILIKEVLSGSTNRLEMEWKPQKFVRKSLTKCSEEVDRLLSALE